MRPGLLFLSLCLLSACGGPREPVLTKDQAMAERRVLDLRVVAIHDAMDVMGPTQGSHLIEVEVLDGAPEYVGKIITLPFDEWAVGRAPPTVGAQLRLAPRTWLVTAADSKGKPIEGWEERPEQRRLR